MSSDFQEISANLVDVLSRRVYPATVRIEGGKIASIRESPRSFDSYLLPGFIDAHVHIESSMLTPVEFARAAVVHGTVATVSDPHEIANVLGREGVEYMLDNAAQVPFKFFFGAPSCVPPTPFETAGARLTSGDVAQLLDDPRIGHLSEMMNYPGVLGGDPEVLAKIEAARQRGKPVDGHAPALRGGDAEAYVKAGISTDHECVTREEAEEKIRYGARILIREGSAARNFDALYTLIDDYPGRCMFCSDDKHPDELLAGHMNLLVRKAVDRGADIMNVLRCASVTPVEHYGLDIGLLREGDDADFIEVDSLDQFHVLRTFIRGEIVAQEGRSPIPSQPAKEINRFTAPILQPEEFQIEARSQAMNVIEVSDGQLLTKRSIVKPRVRNGLAVSDPDRDLLKITVVNRYEAARPATAFVKNFGLKRGAIASSVAHDCHNLVAVGVADEDLCAAVNLVIQSSGGLSVAADGVSEVLPLPIAGLMATGTCSEVGESYASLDRLAKDLGTTLRAPFMTLSFMALLVIPEIKLSDKGLFDGNRFEFIPLFQPD